MRVFLAALILLFAGEAKAADFIDSVEGVYSDSKPSQMADGEALIANSYLTVLKIDDQTAFLDYDLVFANAHTCTLSGLFRVEGDHLHFKDENYSADDLKDNPDDQPCELAVKSDGKNLVTSIVVAEGKNSLCRNYCGARGSMEYDFPLSRRGKIKDKTKIMQSDEYKQATGQMPHNP